MSRPRIRPRFVVPLQTDAETARRRIQRALRESEGEVRGGRIGQRYELTVPHHERHYWSPHLSLVIGEDEDGTLVAEGRFGPHPSVWTMFVAIYAHVIFLGIAGLMYGLSQWILGQDAWALWGVPIAAVLWVIVYVSAFYGQGLGRDQMYRLRSFVEDALEADETPPAEHRG